MKARKSASMTACSSAEFSPDVIARFDASLRCIYANPAIEAAFGALPEAFVGRRVDDCPLPDDVIDAYRSALEETFADGGEQRTRFVLGEGDALRYFVVRIVPEQTDGEFTTVLTVTYDVTERMHIEAECDALLVREKVARSQAESAAVARDQFLALVSHELRSPLHGIQSWTHVLEHKLALQQRIANIADPLVARALAGIKASVDKQVRLVEDLLDATSIMTGKMHLAKRRFPLREAVEAALEPIALDARAKGVQLGTAFALDDDEVDGDSGRITQIVWNLLSNAVKFTPAGGRVMLRVEPEADGLSARIVVADNGRGIAADFLPNVFDLFALADSSYTRSSDGLGLGLTLVSRLTQMHGGHVDVASEGESRGATFTVVLPLAAHGVAATVLPSDVRQLPSLDGFCVLVIDDQLEARESLAAMLEESGAAVVPAASGREALSRLAALGPHRMPDVVICDIAMPDEDGYQTLAKIRAWERASGVTPERSVAAIALTAFAQREDKSRALSRGFRLHFAKPVDPFRLLGAIASLKR